MKIKRLYEYKDIEFEEEEDDSTHENEDGVCFYCGSQNINYEDFYMEYPYVYQSYYCEDCERSGTIEYTIKFNLNKGDEIEE